MQAEFPVSYCFTFLSWQTLPFKKPLWQFFSWQLGLLETDWLIQTQIKAMDFFLKMKKPPSSEMPKIEIYQVP